MSSDSCDFDFAAPVGLPTAGGGRSPSSDDAACDFGPTIPRGAGAIQSDFDFVLPAPSKVGLPRRRPRTALPRTSGTFWLLAATKDSDSATPTHTVQGLVEMQRELLREGGTHKLGGPRGGRCGSLVYSIRRSVLLNNLVTLPSDFNTTSRVASFHALAAIGESTVGTGETIARF